MAQAVAEHIEKRMRIEEKENKKRKGGESQSQSIAVKARVGDGLLSNSSASSAYKVRQPF